MGGLEPLRTMHTYPGRSIAALCRIMSATTIYEQELWYAQTAAPSGGPIQKVLMLRYGSIDLPVYLTHQSKGDGSGPHWIEKGALLEVRRSCALVMERSA